MEENHPEVRYNTHCMMPVWRVKQTESGFNINLTLVGSFTVRSILIYMTNTSCFPVLSSVGRLPFLAFLYPGGSWGMFSEQVVPSTFLIYSHTSIHHVRELCNIYSMYDFKAGESDSRRGIVYTSISFCTMDCNLWDSWIKQVTGKTSVFFLQSEQARKLWNPRPLAPNNN